MDSRLDVTVLPASWTEVLPPEAGGSWSPSLSPDGSHCAYISDRAGRPQVWVQSVGSTRAFRVETGPAPVVAVQWSSGGGWLACQVAPGGAARPGGVVGGGRAAARGVAGAAGRVGAASGGGLRRGDGREHPVAAGAAAAGADREPDHG